MQKNIFKYSALVFAGGASYGVMGSTIKLAYGAGLTWTQTVATQALFGVLLFGLGLLVYRLRGHRLVPLTPKGILSLLALGLNTCTTCVLYNFALTLLPAAVALTLLFQFTWIGIIIQVVVTKRPPRKTEIGAALVIVVGTLLASGLFSSTLTTLNPLGMLCALLAALSCALFMFFSSRVGTNLPPLQRGFGVCLGSCVLAFTLCPGYFASEALQRGAWEFGIVLGCCSLFIPVILFGIATPRLSTGLSTIMASSELPCGIILSVIILGESIDALQISGIGIILAGVALAQITSVCNGAPNGNRTRVSALKGPRPNR